MIRRLALGLFLVLCAATSRAASLPTPTFACNAGNVDSTTCDAASSGTTITKPTHCIAGDLAVADLVSDGSDITALSGGWTFFGAQLTVSGFVNESAYRILGDGEPASYTMTTTGGTQHGGRMTCWANVAQSSPFDVESTLTSTGTSFAIPSLTTTNPNALIISSCLEGAAAVLTEPGGYVREATNSFGGTNTAWAVQGAAGATGTVTWTSGTSVTLACRNAAFHYNSTGTRIYLPSSGAPAVSPTFGSVWEKTSDATRIAAVFTRGSTAMTTVTGNEAAGDTTAKDHLIRQYAIQIGAQTISGVVQCNARAAESTTALDAHASLYIQLADSGGSLTSEVLLDGTGGTGVTDEYGTTLAARNFPRKGDTRTLTSQTAGNNDYLIVEFGDWHNQTAATVLTYTFRFGDTASTPLDRDDVETTDNHPWCDFLSGLAAPAAGTCSNPMALMGAGCR